LGSEEQAPIFDDRRIEIAVLRGAFVRGSICNPFEEEDDAVDRAVYPLALLT
jgi:hypothetical protein